MNKRQCKKNMKRLWWSKINELITICQKKIDGDELWNKIKTTESQDTPMKPDNVIFLEKTHVDGMNKNAIRIHNRVKSMEINWLSLQPRQNFRIGVDKSE